MKPIDERRRRSALEVFSNCEGRFRAEYIDDLGVETPVMRRGQTFHAAKQNYIERLVAAKVSADADLARESMTLARVMQPVPNDEWQDLESLWYRHVEKWELPLRHYYAVEPQQLAKLGTKWRPDLVLVPSPHVLELHDDKTHWSLPSEDVVRASFQSRFYLANARRAWPGFDRYAMKFHYVRFGVTVPVAYTDAELDEVDRQVGELVAAMDTAEGLNVFHYTPGAHCQTCPVPAACPIATNAMAAPIRLATMADAERVIVEMEMLNRAYAMRKALLRPFADEHGAVKAGGVEWANREVVSKTFPVGAVVEKLATVGMGADDADVHLTLGKTSMKRLLTLKRFAHVSPLLAPLAQEETTTEFSRKVVADMDGLQKDEANP